MNPTSGGDEAASRLVRAGGPVPDLVPAVRATAVAQRGRRADEPAAVPQVLGGDRGVPVAGHRAEPRHGPRVQGESSVT